MDAVGDEVEEDVGFACFEIFRDLVFGLLQLEQAAWSRKFRTRAEEVRSLVHSLRRKRKVEWDTYGPQRVDRGKHADWCHQDLKPRTLRSLCRWGLRGRRWDCSPQRQASHSISKGVPEHQNTFSS